MDRFGVIGAMIVGGAHAAGPLWPDVCTAGSVSVKFPFCDASKSMDDRAADLVSRLTLEEKQSILGNTAAAVPRLGIPAYQWWSEGLHGPLEPCVSDGGVTKCPTNFPAASAMASALNDTLYLGVGSAVGVEGRSISNLRNHDNKIGDGLTYWAPNANMERDPRWGRNQEAPGEDPHLTSKYIANYVRGLQEGQDPNYVQMVATCKHFIANSLEHGPYGTRHNFDAEIPLPELTDYYMPAFKSCVQEGRGLGIMCSYNAVNGVPMCANRELLTDVLRDEWGFDGYVTSDCGAISDITNQHHFVPDGPTAAAAGLKAGCDTDCGGVYGSGTVKAVSRSILSNETIDLSLRRLVKIQMRVGLFEPKDSQMYFDKSRYGIQQIDTPEHQQLALEAALQSIVLLKNDKNILPLKRGQKLALVGPHVNGQEVFMSNYHGSRCSDGKFDCIPSPSQVFTKANTGGSTVTQQGVSVAGNSTDGIPAAVAAVEQADVAILFMGIDGSQEGEEHDRLNNTLPGMQIEFVQKVLAVGKPTVLVLIHGGAMSLGSLKDSTPAIVDAFYGGERGAEALAAVLFGDYNPSGKLPVTMYPPEYMYQIPITQMSVTAPPGRTHLHYTGTPEFAFGSGLSYSKWSLSAQEGIQEITTAAGKATFAVKLTNHGPMAGRQRVLAFAKRRVDAAEWSATPKQVLWGYAGAELGVGESTTVSFDLVAAHLARSNEDGHRLALSGDYDIWFSDGVSESRTMVRITGSPVVVERSALKKRATTVVV